MQFVPVGSAVSQPITLVPSFGTSCNTPVVESVRVQVTDPQGREVEATAELQNSNQLPATAIVRFTASELGEYHLRAIFEPNLGSAQTDVVVGRDLTTRTPVTLHRLCDQVQPLSNGSYLCGDAIVRPDGAVIPLEGPNSAGAGNVIWSLGTSKLARYEDSGAGMPTPVEFEGPLPMGEYRFIGATENDLLLLTDSGLHRFVYADGAVAPAGFLSSPGTHAFRRDGNEVWLLESGSSTLPDGPQQPWVSACRAVITDTGFTRPEPCTVTLSGNLRGVDEDGIWLSQGDVAGVNGEGMPAGTTVTLTLVKLTGGTPHEELVYRLPSGYFVRSATFLRDAFSAGNRANQPASVGGLPEIWQPVAAFAPWRDGSSIILERFGTSLAFSTVTGVRGNGLWISDHSAGTTRIFPRGP